MSAIVEITAADYHSDLIADQPSLSASLAHILCSSSPAHARAAHPRLNPNYKAREEERFDIGTAAHAMILEGRDAVEIIHHGDYRTNAAKEDRDAARAAGKIPLLLHVKQDVDQMVAAAGKQLLEHEASPPLFTNGHPEQTLVWNEGDVVCRARIDWLRDDCTAADDLKTTSRSANPDAYSRALFSVGGDVQAAFYLRGIKAVTGVDAEWRWCVVETAPPYALSVIAPGPDVLTIGQKKVEWAIARWRRCLAADEWPAYSTKVCYADLPPWEEASWLMKEEREAA